MDVQNRVVCSIGQDSHAFSEEWEKPLILGGILFEDMPGLRANSDGDVVLHAITNAISGITCYNVLGEPADRLCRSGETNSAAYLNLALEHFTFTHLHPTGAVNCSPGRI